MNILLAFDKYKGSLSASGACQVAAAAIAACDPSITINERPLSDGGEGFCEVVTEALGGVVRDYMVTGPDLRRVSAQVGYVFLDSLAAPLLQLLQLPPKGLLAIVEMAQASGHQLIHSPTRNPWHYSTVGVGELIRYAHTEGASAILLGVGGSATNDMGVGALEALGLRAWDAQNHCVSPMVPVEWDAIERFEAPPYLPELQLRIACDVRNPLHGPSGAAAVFGPQKGLTDELLPMMQASMERCSNLLLATEGLRRTRPQSDGMGAAGGLPFGLSLAFETRLLPGFDFICEALNLQTSIAQADLILSGEGYFDASSLSGKGPGALMQLANDAGKKIVLLPGKACANTVEQICSTHPAVSFFPLEDPNQSLEFNMERAAEHLHQRVQSLMEQVQRHPHS
jgi:glycerate 2-kinase